MARTEDPDAILGALVYVGQLHQDLTVENGAPPLGSQNQVVEAILADPALTAYVREWAKGQHAFEASMNSPERPPIDDTYRRVRDLLLRVEKSSA